MPRIPTTRTTAPTVTVTDPASATPTPSVNIPGGNDSFSTSDASTVAPVAPSTTTSAPSGPTMSPLRLESAHLTSTIEDTGGGDHTAPVEDTGGGDHIPHVDNDAVTAMSPELRQVLADNPEIKTNQDMINFAFEQGGDIEGATAYLEGLGLEMEKLTASRSCPLVKPSAAAMQASVLCAVLKSNPDIETNQDMINFAFDQGRTFAGAAEYLKGLGLDINELLADRNGMLKPLQVPEGVEEVHVEENPPTETDMMEALLRRYPGLETNQDLINHAFDQGGDFAGATKYLERFGVDIQELLADRSKRLPDAGPSPLEELLAAHPDIRTNQDFINLAFAEGGSYSGASDFAARYGVSMDQLIANRNDQFDTSLAVDPVGPIDDIDVPTAITAEQLRQIVPTMSRARANSLVPHINRAMAEANINTPKRKAAFIAQIAHESDGFRTNEEYASGAAYEGRRDLGNTQRGDGRRFKGRGFIQLTGRSNYTRASRDLGIDLVSNPEYAATNEGAAKVTAWFWNENNLNRYADSGQFTTLTRRINGGTNGLADRQRYYARARRIFGA